MKYDEKDPAQRIIALEAKIQRQRSELKSKQLRIIDLDGRAEFFCREWKRLGGGDENVELLQSRARIDQLEAELAEAKNALMVSEQYRRAYAAGKFALYSMGGEITEAACKHLPCSEGPLDRYTDQIEREHSPRLVQERAELIRQLEVREAELAEARKDGERLDEAARGQYSIRYNAMNEQWEVTTGDLHPAHRRSTSRKTIRAAIDAARGAK